jgi:hypothetical protein
MSMRGIILELGLADRGGFGVGDWLSGEWGLAVGLELGFSDGLLCSVLICFHGVCWSGRGIAWNNRQDCCVYLN